jgi:hypothetical protein
MRSIFGSIVEMPIWARCGCAVARDESRRDVAPSPPWRYYHDCSALGSPLQIVMQMSSYLESGSAAVHVRKLESPG